MSRFLSYVIRFEPVLSAAGIQAALSLVLAFGVHLTPVWTASIEAAAAATLALINAALVDKVTAAVVTGLLTAVGSLLVLAWPHVHASEVAAVSGIVAFLMAAVLDGNVTSKARLAAQAAKPAPAAAGL